MQSSHIPADTKRSIKQTKLRDRAPTCPVMMVHQLPDYNNLIHHCQFNTVWKTFMQPSTAQPLTHANFINTTSCILNVQVRF